MVIAKFIKSEPGIYVITNIKLSNKYKKKYKVGKSINLRKRLDNYHTCFPSKRGFWVYNLIILKKNINPRNFENRLHTFLRNYPEIINVEMDTRVRKTEWYRSKLYTMKKAMDDFVKLNKNQVKEHINKHLIIDNIK